MKQKFTLRQMPNRLGSSTEVHKVKLLLGVVWVVTITCFFACVALDEDRWLTLFLVVATTGFALLFGLGVFYWTRLSDRLMPLYYGRNQLRKLAGANGLKYFTRRPEQYDKNFYPAIAQLGIRGREEYGCMGIVADLPITIYIHTYRGLFSRESGRTWTLVYKITMPRLMPHTFLQTHDNVNSGTITAVARTFDDNQRVSLQNDLDEYFLFYTHRRTVTEGLALWSPQLLYELRKLKCRLSVETIGNTVYFYSNNNADELINMEEEAPFIEKVIESLKRSLRVEFLKLPNNAKYPFLRSRPTGGVVAMGGRYINYGWFFLGFYALYHTFRTLISHPFGSNEFWQNMQILLVISVVTALILLFWRSSYTRTKNRRGI